MRGLDGARPPPACASETIVSGCGDATTTTRLMLRRLIFPLRGFDERGRAGGSCFHRGGLC